MSNTNNINLGGDTTAGNMDPIQDILDVEQYIKDNIIEACKELHNKGDKLKPSGIIETARSKIPWLDTRSMFIEYIIHNEAVRIVAESYDED